MTSARLQVLAVASSAAISFGLTPLVRRVALRFGFLDTPSSSVKTHKEPTPVFGGVAIFAAYVATLVLLRYKTRFPTGTLYSLRGLLIGGTIVFLLGVADDLRRPEGIGYRGKFAAQFLAAGVLAFFGMRIRFISPDYLAVALTIIWVVGITNAFNIIDIMDGLSASQAAIAALAFLFISVPSEELYVNFASAALAGAAIGFLPWNLSKRRKIFMGDSGSLLLGFLLSGIALGTKYSEVNDFGPFAPIFILLVPMYDTFFVMILRLKAGQSPFLGSKDHFALRLERVGYTRPKIVVMAAAAAAFLGFCGFLATLLPMGWALALYAVVLAEILLLSRTLAKVAMT